MLNISLEDAIRQEPETVRDRVRSAVEEVVGVELLGVPPPQETIAAASTRAMNIRKRFINISLTFGCI